MVTVLLIDDESSMRIIAKRMLQSLNLQVIEAEDGAAGVALFEKHRPDLVITDIMMPAKDGIETLREIRSLDPEAAVIVMSGGGGAKYPNPLGLAREMGATAALTKPFRRDDLLAAVSRVLALA